MRHGAEWLAAKVGIEARQDDSPSTGRERRHDIDDATIQELRFVDGDDLGRGVDALRDLG